MNKYAIGTYRPDTHGNYIQDGLSKKYVKRFIRNRRGMFSRDYSRIAIYTLTGAVVVLTCLVLAGITQIRANDTRNEALRKDVIEANARGYKSVLDASLRQIANLARMQSEASQDFLGMTETSIALTQTLKDQILSNRKLNGTK